MAYLVGIGFFILSTVVFERAMTTMAASLESFNGKWLFEGDISGLDAEAIKSTGALKDAAKNGVNDEQLRWPDRTVPYVLSEFYTEDQKNKILRAMTGFEKTCIRFVERDKQSDFLRIAPALGCSSNVGRVGGKQPVIVSPGCFDLGTIQHELMHALGFWHEQSRTDRDDYVMINTENILPEDLGQFQVFIHSTAFNQPYDFGSVMHYGQFAFAKVETVWTIKPKPQYEDKEIGQRKWLSDIDINKINLMYKCSENQLGITPTVKPNKVTTSPERGTAAPTRKVKARSVDPVFDKPHRGCYFPNWAQSRTGSAKYTAEDLDPSLCTYIIVAHGNIVNSTLQLFRQDDGETFKKFTNFKIKYPNLKLFLSIGGRTRRSQLSDIAMDAVRRKTFIMSVVTNLRKWGIDGLDVDWDMQITKGSNNKDILPVLLEGLYWTFELESAQSGNQRLALSVALYTTPRNFHFNGSDINGLLDIVNVIAYNQGSASTDRTTLSHHAPFLNGPFGAPSSYNMVSILKQWVASGISKSKLVAGLPLYGRGWLLQDPNGHDLGSSAVARIPASVNTKELGAWPYYEICQAIKSDGAVNVFNPDIGASYAYTDTWWFGYDDQETIRKKTKWVRDNDFGGVYVWDVSQDDFHNSCGDGKNPLLNAIREELS